MTNAFAAAVKKVEPYHDTHIEICEQMLRFAKYFSPKENITQNKQFVIDIPLTIDSNCAATMQQLAVLDITLFANIKIQTPLFNPQMNKEKIKMIAMHQRFYNILQECAH
jgi:hypothetical protein